MNTFRCISKPVVYLVAIGVTLLGFHAPSVQAAIISTQTVLNNQQAQIDRQQLRDLLRRDDVKQQLLERGVDPTEVRARVDSLTDTEVRTLNAKIDELPAGRGLVGAAVLVFLVLLVTDIVGLTDVFPFVKKPARR